MMDIMHKFDDEAKKSQEILDKKDEKKVRLYTEKYLEDHWDELNHDEVSLYQNLSVDFIKKHAADINFKLLSANSFLTFEILDRFTSRISWVTISINGKILSDSFLYNYSSKLYWPLIMRKQQLDLKLLVALSEKYRRYKAKNRREFWQSISRYQKFDSAYVEAYKKYLDFDMISANDNLDLETVDELMPQLNPEIVFYHIPLTKEFIEKYYDKFKKFKSLRQPKPEAPKEEKK